MRDLAGLRRWLHLNWPIVAVLAAVIMLYLLAFGHDASRWHAPAFHWP